MGTSRRKLLLVDDDFVVLSLLSNLFTDKYDVIEKRSCSEALEYLNKEHVDCIVLDLVMEGVDGFGFLSTYNKAKNKQPFVPVVVISSLDNIEARQKAFSLGAVDFIAKPFNSFDVKNRVDNLVSIFHLASKQEQSQVKYKTMARVDELTHIDNRRGLKAKTENLFGPKADGSTYVFMFDIDDFKSINDTGGHFTGDLVLIKFASLLKSFVERDDALGRIGGDEFILVKTKQNDESALKIGNQILKRVEEKSFGNLENQLSTSFGVVSVPNGMSFEDAYSNADKLLYQAKNEGKNCFCF